jgi:hypothetical protein
LFERHTAPSPEHSVSLRHSPAGISESVEQPALTRSEAADVKRSAAQVRIGADYPIRWCRELHSCGSIGELHLAMASGVADF